MHLICVYAHTYVLKEDKPVGLDGVGQLMRHHQVEQVELSGQPEAVLGLPQGTVHTLGMLHWNTPCRKSNCMGLQCVNAIINLSHVCITFPSGRPHAAKAKVVSATTIAVD